MNENVYEKIQECRAGRVRPGRMLGRRSSRVWRLVRFAHYNLLATHSRAA